ncbi:GNAT family N-acetyltransferase [Lapidilactobacillus luobeiensis]|uniref:GNAT family N-acetyltransferase n=1 Tax=Lapidilactobacillus luobeiensis TaxID=2950371 RepID=UPI0021C4389E|nr:GNAT family N-acetyltransferase [Lapidilactobacillus luobeiensis]
MMKLSGSRIYLRPFQNTDGPLVNKLGTTPLYHQTAGFAIVRNAGECQQVLTIFQQRPDSFVIVRRADEQPVGLVELNLRGVDPASGLDRTRELGFVLLQEYWGQGLMTEALQVLLDWAFPHLNLTEVWAGHYENNERSARLLQKIGFEFRYDVALPFKFIEQTNEKYYLLTANSWQRLREKMDFLH